MAQCFIIKRGGGSIGIKPLIPIMTSNTTPKGIAKASRNSSGKEAWRAFANVLYPGWQIDYTQVANTNDYLMYTFASPVKSVKSWTLISAKEVTGNCNIDIIAILNTNKEIKLSNITTYGDAGIRAYSEKCDLKNVKAFKFKPTSFTEYNQITINNFQCYGEE